MAQFLVLFNETQGLLFISSITHFNFFSFLYTLLKQQYGIIFRLCQFKRN